MLVGHSSQTTLQLFELEALLKLVQEADSTYYKETYKQ